MDEVFEFFKGLFSADEWPARWNCGYWSSFHGWLYIFSDLLIWFAYFAIPTIILYFLFQKKPVLRYRPGYFFFAAFILLCGSTHYVDVIMFWIPMYRLNALIRLATGAVSIATVFYLIKILPDIFKLKTTEELQLEIKKREEAEWRLAEANRNLQTFVYIASHDLQEPLRKIATFSSMLAESNKEIFDEQSKLLAQRVIGSAHRLQGMIRDILELSSINQSVELKPIDVREAIEQAMEDLEVKIKEKQSRISIGDIPPVLGYIPYLKQLFVNLISNAMKFSTATPVINITAERSGAYVNIHVTDNGIGMANEDLSKIFEVFQRLHPRTQYEGAGIGLAICKRIAEVHKGKLEVKSTVGLGTTFTIQLQAAD